MLRDVAAGIDELGSVDQLALSETAATQAVRCVAGLEGKRVNDIAELTEEERVEAVLLGRQLVTFIKERMTVRPVIVDPRFRGCGLLEEAEGDVLAGRTLLEIESVERTFRSGDFRQVIVYGALNYGAQMGC